MLVEPISGLKAERDECKSIPFLWSLLGPGFPSEGGTFKLKLSTPKVHFMTNICHPMVDKLERIHLDILKGKWCPALQIHTALLSIQALFSVSINK